MPSLTYLLHKHNGCFGIKGKKKKKNRERELEKKRKKERIRALAVTFLNEREKERKEGGDKEIRTNVDGGEKQEKRKEKKNVRMK